MGKIKVTSCGMEGLYVIEPTVFYDERGYFVETYKIGRASCRERVCQYV